MPAAQYPPAPAYGPPKLPFKEELRDRIRGLLTLAGIGFLIWGLFTVFSGVYAAIDSAGWMQHQQETKVSWKGGQEWIVGEYRNCTMGKYDTTLLFCAGTDGMFGSDDAAHVLTVRYWGKIQRKSSPVYDWKCQRKEESLLCWAVD